MRNLIVPAALILLSLQGARATTIHVPGDYPTIGAGVDGAVPGDTVLVACGTYVEDVIRLSSGIWVRSETGSPDCVEIRPVDHAFDATGIENTCIEGFTVSRRDDFSQAARCDWASVTFSDCVFRDFSYRCAVECEDSHVILIRCSFDDVHVREDDSLAPLRALSSRVELTDCTFFSNSGPRSGGIFADGDADSHVTLTGCSFTGNSGLMAACVISYGPMTAAMNECTFSHNESAGGAAIGMGDSSQGELENCIVSFNEYSIAVGCLGSSTATLWCCNIYGNEFGDWVNCIEDQLGINGNICADPLFCDPENGDFHLHCTSPCAPFTPPNEECDLIGAWPVGCGATGAISMTWGGIKALFGSGAGDSQ